jgi:3-hydroxy acid dehydrogenase/malonic semialdehyde reductase
LPESIWNPGRRMSTTTIDNAAESRTALVTGAGSGIGQAIAVLLHEAGLRVVLVDKDAAALKRTQLAMDGAGAIVQIDISDAGQVDALPNNVPEHFRPLDVLVNAAGHDPGGTTRFDQGSADDWASAIETNLLGTMRVTRSLIQDMLEHGRGDIVNIGSVAGLRIVPDMTAYNTSKAGLHAFSDQLRADLADTPLRVIEILPGLTKTDLIRKRYRGDEKRTADYYQRFGMALEPEDIARTVLYALNAPPHMVLAQALVLPVNRW